MSNVHFSIHNDDSDAKLTGRVEVTRQKISIFFDGFTTAGPDDTQRPPVVINRNSLGNPELSVWAIINEENPTHKVALGGAAESYRCKPKPSMEIPAGSLDEWCR